MTTKREDVLAALLAVSVNGSPKVAGTHFNLDTSTGLVTFTPGNLPGAGQAVTAGYEFDVRVRFDTDLLQTLTIEQMGEIRSIPLIEVRA